MTTIKIAAVGDILMWERQIESAMLSNGTYSFDDMFKEVKPYLSKADLTIGNLETTFSGREANYIQRQTGTQWPLFNCPDELAGTLKKCGFDVLTTANNHCLDRGPAGLTRTLDILDQHQILHTGTFRSKAEAKNFLITKVKGISIGILSYTYGTNVKLEQNDPPWLVNYLSDDLLLAISEVRKQVDFLIVCLHFGIEFRRFPSIEQRTWVKKCFQHGADAVLGAHPHVLQPMAFEQINNKKRFVIYSLGNFISDRFGCYVPNRRGKFIPDRLYNIYNDSGVIVNLTITKNDQGETQITDVSYVPTWVHLHKSDGIQFSVLPLQLPSKHPLPSHDLETMEQAWQNTTSHLKGKIEF